MGLHKQMIGKIGPGSAPKDVYLKDYIERRAEQEYVKPTKLTFDEWVQKTAVHYHLAARDGDWSIDKALRKCWKAAQENK